MILAQAILADTVWRWILDSGLLSLVHWLECSAGPISTQLNNNLTSANDESSGCRLHNGYSGGLTYRDLWRAKSLTTGISMLKNSNLFYIGNRKMRLTP